jgi:hypothetical protein
MPEVLGHGEGGSDVGEALQVPASAVPQVLRDSTSPKRAYTIKVYGEEKTLPEDEIVKLAQKGAAADQKFQEVAAQLKAASKDKVIVEDIRKMMQEGDIEAFRRVGAAFNIPGDQVEETAESIKDYLEIIEAGGNPDEPDDSGAGYTGDDVGAQVAMTRRMSDLEAAVKQLSTGEVKYGKLAPDVQRALRIVEADRINKNIKSALDKDETIGYYMKVFDEAGQTAVRELVDTLVKTKLQAAGGDFGDDGAEIFKEVLPIVRKTVEGVAKAQRAIPPMGFGPSPGGGNDVEVYPRKKPQYIPSSKPGFEQNVLEEMAFHLASSGK